MTISRSKRMLLTGAAALGVAAGAAGIAGAATGGTPNDKPADAVEEHQDPSYTSSITVDDTTEAADETAEAAELQKLATVNADEARQAAGAAVKGTVGDAELDNENGNVVWSVEVTAEDGTVTEVVIDAGNGNILAQSAEDDETGDNEGDEANEGPEQEAPTK